MTLKEAAHALKLPASNPAWGNIVITGCATDSRKVKNGDLFVCLKGEKADGHDFAAIAAQNGAAAILAEKCLPSIATPVLQVDNTVGSLGILANYWRSKFLGAVIGVTGTAGKTTLKNMLVGLLSEKGKAEGSSKNNNNQIGLPRSMLNLSGEDDFWVLEAGISHSGDMDDLGAIIEPDLAIIINAGPGHNEGLQEKGVAWNKARLLKYVRKDGCALICSDYPELVEQMSAYRLRKHSFSVQDFADYRLLASDWQKGEYLLDGRGRIVEIKIPFYGAHFAELAGLAASCALLCGLSPEEIQKGFNNITLPEGRFKKIEQGNWLIVDDSYNANPLSMQKMLQSVAQLAEAEKRPLFLVLAEMKELGEKAANFHKELGRLLAGLNTDRIFWKGAYLEELRTGYVMAQGKSAIIPFESLTDFKNLISSEELNKRGAILFKGSRSNQLENYLATFQDALAEI